MLVDIVPNRGEGVSMAATAKAIWAAVPRIGQVVHGLVLHGRATRGIMPRSRYRTVSGIEVTGAR
jgi:hypothetical protein